MTMPTQNPWAWALMAWAWAWVWAPNVGLCFTPNPNFEVQIFEFTYCNNRFLVEAINQKLDKYAILHPFLSQLGWIILPPVIITTRIRGILHTTIVNLLQNLQIPNSKIHKLMDIFSQIAISYLTYIILNKRKLDKKQIPVPLN